MGKKVLVLSGGSIKGAFQAGAIEIVLSQGFEPDKILGISVGALNSTFLVNERGKSNNQTPWPELGKKLTNFWLENNKSPDKLVKKRKFYTIAYEFLFKRFRSLISTKPLQMDIIRPNAVPEYLRKADVELAVGATNLYTGEIRYFTPEEDNIVEAVIASTAIPIVMPYIYIDGEPYVDGGVRDVLPIRPILAAHEEIDEMIIISCHPRVLLEKYFNPGDLITYTERVKNITVNEIINNDLVFLQEYNNKLAEKGKNKIKYKIIRPPAELGVNITNFDFKDIKNMIQLGRDVAVHSRWKE